LPGRIQGAQVRETALIRENYREEFPQVDAHFIEKNGSVPRHSPSPHEWQGFRHRLHEAGHQPYCLVWP
jgi:hypothetical protein